ncbi:MULTISPECIES: heavy metal-binding domain-containing protein [Pacificibacter]|uniref:heavy metal-binding domain-containing protein n=1 Tax=Pacificibacter TaxID=1042323 RepID=UPI001C0A0BD9|nr:MULTISPECIES: heavy metal-binding domain-containing protein [Pacificibacter]MBU2936332.1 heavy metal-binding domain-containing protein [Pacificibacter marinus]MDO6616630.1 heavy metal-binding domain-containing protein [Pacificibacter sp. 1_MG-2023]
MAFKFHTPKDRPDVKIYTLRVKRHEASKKEAHTLGANTVIASDLNYSEFFEWGAMLMMAASRTAVRGTRQEDQQKHLNI